MGKAEKKLKLPKSSLADEEPNHPIEVSSDDEEANQDLSLKIVEKAISRASSNGGSRHLFTGDSTDGGDGEGFVVNLSSTSESEVGVVSEDGNKKRKKEKKKKSKKAEAVDDNVGVAKIEQVAGTSKSQEAEILLETNPVEKADNVVLRKLLRGPRYFDPPDSNWGNCYNCGEEGHTTANCTSARRQKPCFVCGSLEHNVKQCKKERGCFICKKGGHRAKDCPEKSIGGSQNAKVCLKCGDSGHDMFSCWSDYSPDDLKEIQCYICKCFGHLCCADTGTGPREVSCYRCGQSGHTGLACTRLRAEAAGNGIPSSCYRCGEEGHFARECATPVKSAKRNRESSIHKVAKKKRKEVKSAPPQYQDKAHKRKKAQYDDGVASSSKSKEWGGWITEDQGDIPHKKYEPNNNGWNSPVTPTNIASRIPIYGSPVGYASSPYYYNNGRRLQFGSPASIVQPVYYFHPHPASNGPPVQHIHHNQQQRYSASRFGNSSNDGTRQYWPNNNSNYWY